MRINAFWANALHVVDQQLHTVRRYQTYRLYGSRREGLERARRDLVPGSEL